MDLEAGMCLRLSIVTVLILHCSAFATECTAHRCECSLRVSPGVSTAILRPSADPIANTNKQGTRGNCATRVLCDSGRFQQPRCKASHCACTSRSCPKRHNRLGLFLAWMDLPTSLGAWVLPPFVQISLLSTDPELQGVACKCVWCVYASTCLALPYL